ncbi:alanine acetyltransferase [Veillonella montpellierensis DNF00314]|uniref:[Ribosomal protein bS18]-alanine N-acetyltransferase n=1 Tax=Veillonella montpellierensis DNF00314 TaxID=1401067 RepID=A0A096ALP2_9FIRM|nr:ribosomal protein S18-alanine N-acetyltransferase [Veillonella montpellierensis]KGF47700.1 alanine acetyltransferase [Veillonella montpellierensis DNF00314]
MILRLAEIDDADGIYQVETDSFSIPWSLPSVIHELEDKERKLYIVAEEDNTIIGYAGAWIVLDEGQITNIAIKSSYRRQGYGTMLTRKLIKELFTLGMQEIFLEVRISNIPAISLYRRLGFTVKGVRKSYYSEPTEDAYIMSLIKEETL